MAMAGIGGGVESMSRTIMGYDSGAWAADPRVALHNYYTPQGIGADLIATLEGYSRTDVDAYAAESQRRAAVAWDEGRFARSIMPVRDVIGEVILDNDEFRRPGTTVESLGALKPAFAGMASLGFGRVVRERYPQVEEINHVHTGGNSSGIVDGSGVVLLGNAEFGKAAGLKPRARMRSWASIGSEQTIMLTAPVAVAHKALKNAGMTADQIDLWELNEAFASVVLRFMDHMEVGHDRINVNGGAIALGHPLGATGAMILGTVLDELERRDLSTAMTLLCVGNGMGTAAIIERV
jgi:acetyl-CoA C-acetyltransferase